MSLSTQLGMSDASTSQGAGLDGVAFPIERSDMYSRWVLEQRQIMVLKWIESEKAGYDIGYHRAAWIWHMNYRKGWLDAMRASGVAGF